MSCPHLFLLAEISVFVIDARALQARPNPVSTPSIAISRISTDIVLPDVQRATDNLALQSGFAYLSDFTSFVSHFLFLRYHRSAAMMSSRLRSDPWTNLQWPLYPSKDPSSVELVDSLDLCELF